MREDVEFEGYSLPTINKPEIFLTDVYGDYMNYPSEQAMGYKHSMFATMSDEELDVMCELAQRVKEEYLNKNS